MAALDAARQVQYDKALTRAKLEGVTVRPCGNGWIASNPTSESRYLVVRRGNALECSCPAGQNDLYCKHRAAVREYLVERAERAASQLAKLNAEREETGRQLRALWDTDRPDSFRLNWLGMSRDERAAWLLAHE